MGPAKKRHLLWKALCTPSPVPDTNARGALRAWARDAGCQSRPPSHISSDQGAHVTAQCPELGRETSSLEQRSGEGSEGRLEAPGV